MSIADATSKIKKSTEALTNAGDAAGAATAAPVKKSFTLKDWNSYVTEQVAKAAKEEATVAQKRLTALAKATTEARAAFEKETSVEVEVFPEATAKVETAKGAFRKSMGQALKNIHVALGEGGVVKQELAKSKSSRIAMKKAAGGDAQAMIEKIADMFDIDLAELEKDGGCLSWRIESAVRVVEQAAKAEKMLAKLSSVLGVKKDKEGVTKGNVNKAAKDKAKKSVWESQLGTKSREPASTVANARDRR